MDRQIDRQTDRQTDRQMRLAVSTFNPNEHFESLTSVFITLVLIHASYYALKGTCHRLIDRHMVRLTDWQIDRQTYRQIRLAISTFRPNGHFESLTRVFIKLVLIHSLSYALKRHLS
jgi:hypothetical protein